MALIKGTIQASDRIAARPKGSREVIIESPYKQFSAAAAKYARLRLNWVSVDRLSCKSSNLEGKVDLSPAFVIPEEGGLPTLGVQRVD